MNEGWNPPKLGGWNLKGFKAGSQPGQWTKVFKPAFNAGLMDESFLLIGVLVGLVFGEGVGVGEDEAACGGDDFSTGHLHEVTTALA